MIRIGNHLLAAAAPVTSPVTNQPAGGSGCLVQSMAFQIDQSPAVPADDEKPKAAGLTVDGGAVRRI